MIFYDFSLQDDEFEGDEEAQDSDISANDEDFEDLSLLRDAAPRKRGPKKNQSNLPDVSVPLGADPIMTSEIQKSSQCHACKQVRHRKFRRNVIYVLTKI